MTGNYRVTATWVMGREGLDPSWLVHIEHMDARPGSRGVMWYYRQNLNDLDSEVPRFVDGATPRRPPLHTLDYKFVLPVAVHVLLDRADVVENSSAAGPDELAGARRLRSEARRELSRLGLPPADAERAVQVLVGSRAEASTPQIDQSKGPMLPAARVSRVIGRST